MFKEDSYIKSIEKYFLTHLGKGIMLSYNDYELIASWKDKNIPLEIILEGIREAFTGTNEINRFDKENKIRNLNSISNYIEHSIKTYLEIQNIDYKIEDKSSDNSINKIIQSINDNIKGINDNRILKKIMEYKNSLINFSSESDSETFKIINTNQKKLYEDIFGLLSESEKNKILTSCKNKLKNNNKNITKYAYEKSITSFRNKLIRDLFNIKFMN